MLELILGKNWRANRDRVLEQMARDVAAGREKLVLLVPEQASHEYERRLCAAAGDRASRYGEVLSFTRLASRVFSQTGGGAVATLDGGGRLLAMAAAVWQLRPRLKAYAAVGTRPEFLSSLVTAVDEFKSCCITPGLLREASKLTEGALAQKLEELSLLLEGYEGICARFGQDPRDRMTKLLEALEEGDFAQTHVFYIDGFSDFTAQELGILEHLVKNAPQVTVSLACDAPGTRISGMELAGETAGLLARLAGGARLETVPDPEADTALGKLRAGLLGGPEPRLPAGAVQAVRLASLREECCYTAARLRELAAGGVRYRDMAVVISDPERYEPLLHQVLGQYGIPAYFAGVEDILHKSAIYTVMTALEAVNEGLEAAWMLRYLKSVLSPLEPGDCDALENYVLAWRIGGKAWGEPFTRHPRGLGRDWEPEDRAALEALNRSREAGALPLCRLEKSLRQAGTVEEQLRGLYAFLEEVSLAKRLEELAGRFRAAGDRRSAQEQEQLWEILVGAMEQMAGLLGETTLETDAFVRLFRLLLSQYHVGTIPQTLDNVTVGGPAAMRRQEARHVFVLGAQEGLLPKGGDGGMVLTEPERQTLMGLGVPLRQDLYRQLEQELAGLLAVATGATERITFTCGAGQSAYVFRRVCRMLGRDPEEQGTLSPLDGAYDPWAAGAMFLRAGERLPAAEPERSTLQRQRDYRLGRLTPETVRGLYGNQLLLSASQVDKAASCRFAYFMRYGLRAEARREITVDPAEFGTFVHYVLEHTAREVCRLGGFTQVSLEKTQALAEAYAEAYQKQVFSDLQDRSLRQTYLFRRNLRELQAVVQDLWEELTQSRFRPGGFEVKFGAGGGMPSVEIPGGAMAARIQGFVDRLDTYEKDGQTYVRVVDYKTGRKDFDYCDVLNGIGLQMLIYLFALEDVGQNLLGAQPQAAGVLYFPARAAVLPTEGPVAPEEARALRQKEARRKGLILADEGVLEAMDGSESQRFLPVKRGKDGSLGGDVAAPGQLAMLKKYVMETLAKLVDGIAGGQVEPNPYVRGDHEACRFCDYGGACHLDLWGEPRVFRAVTGPEFWQQVEKEENHGK